MNVHYYCVFSRKHISRHLQYSTEATIQPTVEYSCSSSQMAAPIAALKAQDPSSRLLKGTIPAFGKLIGGNGFVRYLTRREIILGRELSASASSASSSSSTAERSESPNQMGDTAATTEFDGPDIAVGNSLQMYVPPRQY